MTNTLLRSVRVVALTAGCALAIPALAAAQAPAQSGSVAGIWNMSLIGDHVIPVALVLEQAGTAVTGTFTLMGKDFPLKGELVGDKLTLTGKGPAFGRPGGDHNAAVAAGGGAKQPATVAGPAQPGANMALADMTITGVADANGGLAGDVALKMAEGTGKIKWSAERFKERKASNEPAMSSAAVDMTGKWTMAVIEAQIQIAFDLKQVGSKVTGTATSDHLGAMALDGTLANGTLTFSTTGSTGGQDVKLEYSGKLKTDGTFAGDLTSPMGSMTWTLTRAKK